MKRNTALLIALALGTSALVTHAQDADPGPDPSRPRHRQGPPPRPPFATVLDANQDGVLDATEVSNASAALLALDANGDGQVTRDEIRPAGRQGPGGPPSDRGVQGRPPAAAQVPPVVAVIDANRDGVLDAGELANAGTALATLDANGDGQLTRDELRPAHGKGPGGPPWQRGEPEAGVGAGGEEPGMRDGVPPAPRAPRGPRPPQPGTAAS